VSGGATRVFALLGDPVAHSLSPAMHNAAFRVLGLPAVYVPLRCAAAAAAADVPALIGALSRAGGGGNVTVPYKDLAARALDRPSVLVERLGACNAFWGDADGSCVGDNTDVAGLLAALDALAAPAAWLVLGTGGGARAVVGAALERGVALAVSSRSEERRRAFESWARDQGVRLTEPAECGTVINATPLGLGAGDPLPLSVPPPCAVAALDMVYGRGETAWTRAMCAAGLRAADGRAMLVAQGAASLERWFPGVRAPVEVMRAAVNDHLR
jgi:shikimate dehydrogenase